MKKYVFKGMNIELTRRCNMACRHCLRGDAQDRTISTEIIDKIIADADNCIKLYIAGGEPLLEPDRLKYLLDQVGKNWDTVAIEITTNGSIMDASIVDALEQFCATPLPTLDNDRFVRMAQLTISHDDFHTSGQWQQAIDFYKPLFDKANKSLGNTQMILKTWSPINPEEVAARFGTDDATIIYAGRAVNLLDDAIKQGLNVRIPPVNNHRLKIVGNLVHCKTMITVNGDVVVAAEDDSYDSYDASTVGNIMVKSLSDIIDDHQNNCVLSCNESAYIDQRNIQELYDSYIDTNTHIPQFDLTKLKTALLFLINDSILRLRKMFKKTYPLLPAQDLIGELPMVKDDSNLDVLAMRIVNNTHWSVKKKLENRVSELENKYASLINSGTAHAVRTYCEAIAYMQDNGLSLVIKLRKIEMQILNNKAKSYSDGEIEPNNDVVFNCGESGIFANENDIGEEYSKDRKMVDLYRAVDEYLKMK